MSITISSAHRLTPYHDSGKDGTEAFEDVGHSDEARAMLPGMLVGELEKGSVCCNPRGTVVYTWAYVFVF